MKQDKKSPLKKKSLRHAGQSLDERIGSLLDQKAEPYALAGIMSVIMAGQEWFRFYFDVLPNPITMTVLAVVITAFCFYKIKKILREVKSIKLGRDGEREVGEILEELREGGCKILHDVVGENFNLDHVLISTKGIYVVETKTYSKPVKGDAQIQYDGQHITTSLGQTFDAPLIQVLAASNWLESLLKQMTAKQFHVRPVVVFPGWWISHSPEAKKAKIWVLNPKALIKILNNQQDSLTQADVNFIHYHLAQHVRVKAA